MIGRILLYILCALLLLLVVLLLLPAQVRFRYDQGDLALWVRFGPVKLQLFPPGEKKEKPEKKPQKEPSQKKEKPKKPKGKINREQILYSLEALPPILGRALRRTGRRLRVAPLKIHLLVAGPDPADTAMLYGKLEAALGAGLPVLHRLVHIREQDIRLFLDFQQEQMDLIADVGVALRPWDLVSVGVRACGSLLKWFLQFRKLASPPPAEETEPAEQTEQTEETVKTEHGAA